MDPSDALGGKLAPGSPPEAGHAGGFGQPSESFLRGLVASVAGGDNGALGRLYDATSGAVLELSQRILGESLEAEEVVLDVYARVWSRATEFNGQRGSVRAWLMIMTRSRSIDVVRSLRARRQKEVALAQVADANTPALAPEQNPVEGMIDAEAKDLLAEAMATLSSAQRIAIESTFFEGLSHERAARVLGQPLGTIKGQVRRGLRRLRQALERHEEVDQ